MALRRQKNGFRGTSRIVAGVRLGSRFFLQVKKESCRNPSVFPGFAVYDTGDRSFRDSISLGNYGILFPTHSAQSDLHCHLIS